MSTSNFATGPAAGEYSRDDENQLPQEDTLIDRGVDDVLDEGYSPPERPYARGTFGSGKSMDRLLSEEEPDPAAQLDSSDEAEREAEFPRRREVGSVRAGRLVAPDLGFGEDTEDELVADDVGISGGAASAEEAAVHIIEDDR